jgi:acyl-CoA hydrolase
MPMPGTQRECVFRFLSQPTDVNWGGNVHGGMVMKWMDQAAYACAVGWCGGYAVTASVGGMSFLKPIRIGDLVEVSATVVLTGTSSMSIAVEVDSIDIRTQQHARTTRCVMVFVAVDSAGKPVRVPAWTPASDADRRLADYAKRLKAELAEAQADLDTL